MALIRRWHTEQLHPPPRRGRAPARDRPPRQALSDRVAARGPARGPRAGLQRLRLGHLVVAVAPAAGRGAASALGDGASSSRSPRWRSRSSRPRACVQVLRTPALWLLVAAAGTHQRRVQLGDRHRRRRPRRPALLPDAAVDRAARARGPRRAADARRRRCASALGADRRGDRPLAAGRRRSGGGGFADLLPLPRSLADWLGVVGGFSFALQQRDAAARGGRGPRKAARWRCSSAARSSPPRWRRSSTATGAARGAARAGAGPGWR